MAEVLWERPEGCLCGAELVERASGAGLVLERRVKPVCPLHGEFAFSMDVVMAAAVDAAQSIPGLKDVDPSRLQRLVREIAPKLIATLPGPRTPPSPGAAPGAVAPQKE